MRTSQPDLVCLRLWSPSPTETCRRRRSSGSAKHIRHGRPTTSATLERRLAEEEELGAS